MNKSQLDNEKYVLDALHFCNRYLAIKAVEASSKSHTNKQQFGNEFPENDHNKAKTKKTKKSKFEVVKVEEPSEAKKKNKKKKFEIAPQNVQQTEEEYVPLQNLLSNFKTNTRGDNGYQTMKNDYSNQNLSQYQRGSPSSPFKNENTYTSSSPYNNNYMSFGSTQGSNLSPFKTLNHGNSFSNLYNNSNRSSYTNGNMYINGNGNNFNGNGYMTSNGYQQMNIPTQSHNLSHVQGINPFTPKKQAPLNSLLRRDSSLTSQILPRSRSNINLSPSPSANRSFMENPRDEGFGERKKRKNERSFYIPSNSFMENRDSDDISVSRCLSTNNIISKFEKEIMEEEREREKSSSFLKEKSEMNRISEIKNRKERETDNSTIIQLDSYIGDSISFLNEAKLVNKPICVEIKR